MVALTYCDIAPGHEWHGPYHDEEYGFPLTDNAALFERLVLEINQAGLSWLTILRKREAFRRAYDGFDLEIVAAYRARDRRRLLADAGIVRNRLKVDAAIANAGKMLELRDAHGSFAAWLDAHHPRSKDEWVRLFKRTFHFTGGEIVGEFLMSIGYLPGAHASTCPVYHRIALLGPAWMRTVDGAQSPARAGEPRIESPQAAARRPESPQAAKRRPESPHATKRRPESPLATKRRPESP